MDSLRPYYKIVNLRKNTEILINGCADCQRSKPFPSRVGEIAKGGAPEEPLSSISSDIWGPFPGEEYQDSGKIWIISFTDLYSRFTLLHPTHSTTGEDVKEAFRETWVSRFGFPNSFLSDQGKQYVSETLNLWLEENDVKRFFACRFNPTGNSLSERPNQMINHIFRSCRGQKLEEVVRKCVRFLNHTINRTLGFTPAEILGEPSELNPLGQTRKPDLQIAKQRMEDQSEENWRQSNSSRQFEKNFQVGDEVFVKNFMKGKIDPYWNGPFLVLQVSDKKNSCLVQEESSSVWENIKNLKLFKKPRNQEGHPGDQGRTEGQDESLEKECDLDEEKLDGDAGKEERASVKKVLSSGTQEEDPENRAVRRRGAVSGTAEKEELLLEDLNPEDFEQTGNVQKIKTLLPGWSKVGGCRLSDVSEEKTSTEISKRE